MRYLRYGCTARIYTLYKTENNKIGLRQYVTLDAYKMNFPKWKRSVCANISNTSYDPQVLFYFRNERFVSSEHKSYQVRHVRPFYRWQELAFFLCENGSPKEPCSSHVCYVVCESDISVSHYVNRSHILSVSDRTITIPALITKKDYNIFKIRFDMLYKLDIEGNNERNLHFNGKTASLNILHTDKKIIL